MGKDKDANRYTSIGKPTDITTPSSFKPETEGNVAWHKCSNGKKEWVKATCPFIEGRRYPDNTFKFGNNVEFFPYPDCVYCRIEGGKRLGGGASGVVYSLPDGTALKLIGNVYNSEANQRLIANNDVEYSNHVCKIFDCVEFPNGCGAVLMEHIDGTTISDLALDELGPKKGSPEIDPFILANNLIAGLIFLISLRIIHGDIKPDNVIQRKTHNRTTGIDEKSYVFIDFDYSQAINPVLFTSTNTGIKMEAGGLLFGVFRDVKYVDRYQVAMLLIHVLSPMTAYFLYRWVEHINSKDTEKDSLPKKNKYRFWNPNDIRWFLVYGVEIGLIPPASVQLWLTILCLLDKDVSLKEVMEFTSHRMSDEECLIRDGIKKTLKSKLSDLVIFLKGLISGDSKGYSEIKQSKEHSEIKQMYFYIARDTLVKYNEWIDKAGLTFYNAREYPEVKGKLDEILKDFVYEEAFKAEEIISFYKRYQPNK